ncbi:uncharacterized protein EV420DRAFT_337200 [Desarmillaria tabescens]|uniref:Uncharacterized protein n=1 Tax=Armillaria tabescens TaxID=1929756 RepID=A0AA39KFA0_ARMTA|nr:uncharacterized protein EV420DRAFT_337200 [Desarmillaria tabescens]KAK0458895.1 hypothetical protein EV420DRAFT_337200 [Desarmillaria tabescens]
MMSVVWSRWSVMTVGVKERGTFERRQIHIYRSPPSLPLLEPIIFLFPPAFQGFALDSSRHILSQTALTTYCLGRTMSFLCLILSLGILPLFRGPWCKDCRADGAGYISLLQGYLIDAFIVLRKVSPVLTSCTLLRKVSPASHVYSNIKHPPLPL